MFWQWRPISAVIWDVQNTIAQPVLLGLFAIGWIVVLIATFQINHFDLFGLRQVYLYFKGQPYTQLKFKKAGFYKIVRHPLMLGFLISFWATPLMTLGHFMFAAFMTSYVFIALIFFEEKELVEIHGKSYQEYIDQTPMILPISFKKSEDVEETYFESKVITESS